MNGLGRSRVGNNQQQGFGGLGLLVSGVAAGIGLASESIHHRKEKKAAKEAAAKVNTASEQDPELEKSQSQLSPSSQESAGDPSGTEKKGNKMQEGEPQLEEGDEEQWDLDDAQDGLIDKDGVSKERGMSVIGPPKRPFERDPKKVIQAFLIDYPIPQTPVGRLSLPVVLPQRRPKDRSRGFIRAYAPDLQACGIDQNMFLDFLETFSIASQANPWINAINLAGFAFIALPTGISQAASLALMMAVNVAKNMHSRHQYNSFLDKINDDFYRPRGLYCMVLTWDPDTPDLEVGINTQPDLSINANIAANITPPAGIAQKVVHSLRPSMGKTQGVAFTETAPLVFPHLDQLDANSALSNDSRTKKQKLASAKDFTSEYFDRRAQAKYTTQNPTSQLNVGPKPTFTSRYADPNNASNSGDILALLTAGELSMPARGGFGGRGEVQRGLDGELDGGGEQRGIGGDFGMGRPGWYGGWPLEQRMAMWGGRFGRGRQDWYGGGGLLEQRMGMWGGRFGRGTQDWYGNGYGQQYPPQNPNQQTLNQQYSNQQYTNQQYPNQHYSNQQYPDQTYPSQKSHNQPYPNQPHQNQEYFNQLPPQNGVYSRGIEGGFGGTFTLASGVKRILRHHVLYLLIVNMPSDAEMADAEAFMKLQGERQSA